MFVYSLVESLVLLTFVVFFEKNSFLDPIR